MITSEAAAPAAADALAPSQAGVAKPLVDVRDLTLRLVSRQSDVTLLHGLSFTLAEREVLCVIGESGSGKSIAMRTLMRLLPPNARVGGTITIGGIDILGLKPRELVGIRGSFISMIFQEPSSALDPAFTIGNQIAEVVRVHERVSRATARERALELLEMVQIPSARRRLDAYAHELSGGLKQRAMIALALSCRPKVLIADEPTTALDATVQIQVLLLLRALQREFGMGTIFVTHDVGVAHEIADRTAVMYAGRIVETGPSHAVLHAPAHPYTAALLRSVVAPEARGTRIAQISGAPPDLSVLPPGCSFAPRCSLAARRCIESVPDLRPATADHWARCVLLDEAVTDTAASGN